MPPNIPNIKKSPSMDFRNRYFFIKRTTGKVISTPKTKGIIDSPIQML